MSKFKKEFTLKQHTPIIHFQSEQIGATLRATELKPKFDKFLKEHAFAGNIPDEFKISKDKDALNYKVKIEQNISQSEVIQARDPLFFGNMGDSEDKKLKQYTKPFKIEFFSYNTELNTHIEKYFEAFLAVTNFATRQSKGFGSFYIYSKELDTSLIPYKTYSFQANDWKKDIGLLYQFLRQGINLSKRPRNPFYTKPAIFAYAKSKNWQWEKKSIKEAYFNTKLKEQAVKHQSDVTTFASPQKYILRDLFGLSSSQQWMGYSPSTIEKENDSIERFKSPITFKVVNNRVYFWANGTVEEILGKEFTIKAGHKKDLKLSTPKEFDFDDFFDFTFNGLDLSKHVSSEFHSAGEYASIKKILTEIKRGL